MNSSKAERGRRVRVAGGVCGWRVRGVGGSLGVSGVCIGYGCKERISLGKS